jgi:hypothetical protein
MNVTEIGTERKMRFNSNQGKEIEDDNNREVSAGQNMA